MRRPSITVRCAWGGGSWGVGCWCCHSSLKAALRSRLACYRGDSVSVLVVVLVTLAISDGVPILGAPPPPPPPPHRCNAQPFPEPHGCPSPFHAIPDSLPSDSPSFSLLRSHTQPTRTDKQTDGQTRMAGSVGRWVQTGQV
ncbi:hypothetical protein E2C01_016448 [Portunus trituberculatus]|uniref:Uncharacterized protein n=1 Tax=Portunus trituberculatus TaxID=210409 RepID=A0A5B7DQX9_PORTR|nr:hypothetical protein [Portunus trituberculatus]